MEIITMRVLWLIRRDGGWRLFFRMRWVRGRSRGVIFALLEVGVSNICYWKMGGCNMRVFILDFIGRFI